MTDTRPPSDMLPEEREERHMSSASVGRPASAGDATGSVALPSRTRRRSAGQDLELAYEHGVELEARSQWAYARMRFFRHKLAVTSLLILIGFGSSRCSRADRSPTARTRSRSTPSTTSQR